LAAIEFIPFKPSHLKEIGLDFHREPSWQAWRDFHLSRSQGYTMLVDGITVGAAGLCLFHPGVAEAWQITTNEWRPYYLRAWLEIRRRLPQLMEIMNLRRVQTSCLMNPIHFTWLKLCGFELEGTMKKYGLLGEDHLRMARVR
jgi:hypothetical protein